MKKLWTIIEKNKLYLKVCENKVFGKFLNEETIAYFFVGMMTTIINFVIFGAFLSLFNKNGWLSNNSQGFIDVVAKHPWLEYIPNITASIRAFSAEISSAVFALTFSFTANKHFVFKSKSWKVSIVSRELAKFLSSRLLSLIVETTVVVLLVSILSLNNILAKLVGTILVIVLNYILNKKVVFKNPI